MNRKRSAGEPALNLLSDCPEISSINFIRTPEYLIGRSTEANLIIRQPSISRRHCTLKHDVESNKWSIISHSRQPVTVRGNEIKAEDTVALECGDKIKISPSLVFEFKCSPNEDMKCCADFKKIKFSVEPASMAVDDNIETAPVDDTPELPATLPISQLPDSSDVDNFRPLEVLQDTDPGISSFRATEPLNDSDSDFYNFGSTSVQHQVDSASFDYEVKSLYLSADANDNSSTLSISELENAIRKYLDSLTLDISSHDYDAVSWKQQLKIELTNRLEYLKKLDDFDSAFESHLSAANDGDIGLMLEALKSSSSFFKEYYSKFKHRSEQLQCGEHDENFSRIIINLDALLMNKTTSVMHFLHKFFDISLKSTLSNPCDSKSSRDARLSDEPKLNLDENKHEKSSNEKNLEAEIEKYKDNLNWKDSRIKFLEMKIKEKEKLELELESVKEENELMETKVAEMKRTLANMEIMELEYKCLLESTKHREEDKRSKDVLERTINTLNNQLKDLKEENGQLVADKFTLQDEIAKLKEKCEDLEDKLKEKFVTTSDNAPTCMGNQLSEDGCCDMVKEIRGSLMDLMEREFNCSICGELFVDSTITSCNHVFCSFCLQEWKKNHKTCPFCRANLKVEVKATMVDEYITGILKLLSDKLYTERMELISERKTKKTPVKNTRAKATRRGRQSMGVVEIM